MGVLKSSDILTAVAGPGNSSPTDQQPQHPETNKRPAKDFDERKRTSAPIARTKPSPYESDLREKLRQKIQLSFGQIPQFINDEFERLAKDANMNKREYFYSLLRKQGAEIPPYDQLDGRKL